MISDGVRIGIDVGGTFTDLVAVEAENGRAHHFKLPSTPSDQAIGIGDGVAALLAQIGAAGQAVAFLGHGTTVVTNLIIERRGAPTGLLTTAGFRDVLEIGRQTRPDLYDYTVERAPALVPRHLRLEIPERLDADGRVLVPLDEAAVERAAEVLLAQGVEAIAIGFLHAYRDDAHERRAGEIVRRVMPCALSPCRRRYCRNSANSNDCRRPLSTPMPGRAWRATSPGSSGAWCVRRCRRRLISSIRTAA